jgi:hypothetical protein
MSVIPAIWEVEIRGSWFKASLDKKLKRPYLKRKLDGGTNLYGDTVTCEAEVRGSQPKASPRQRHNTRFEKQTKAEMVGGIAYEVLSSNHRTAKKLHGLIKKI